MKQRDVTTMIRVAEAAGYVAAEIIKSPSVIVVKVIKPSTTAPSPRTEEPVSQ